MATLERQQESREGDQATPERRLPRPPAPLSALLALVLVLVCAWALVTPPWQAPDETEHFAYVQAIAELHRLPGGAGEAASTELSHSTDVASTVQTTFSGLATPSWSKSVADAWGAQPAPSRTNGGGPNTASSYPPLYYALEAIPYAAGSSGGIFTRLSLVRIASGLWLLVTVTAAWLMAGELFGRRRLPQLVAAATVGLWPLMTFVSASTNPDALVVALWTLACWLAVKALRRGLTLRRGVALGAVTGAALVTKISSLVLAPLVVVVLLVAAWRDRARWRPAIVALAGGLLALGAPLAAWMASQAASGRASYAQASEISANAGAGHGFMIREFLSYLWQFYLPRLPFMTPVHHQYDAISTKPAINIWLGTGSGVFGWVNVWFPRGVYWAVGGALALALVGFAAATWRWWRAGGGHRRRRLAPAAFLIALAVLTLGALHYTDYGFYAAQKGMFIQGRYLLPLAGVLAAFAGWALHGVPRRWQGAAAGAWVGALLVFQIASLGLMLERFYA